MFLFFSVIFAHPESEFILGGAEGWLSTRMYGKKKINEVCTGLCF
jgi:hypothetical protein